MNFFRFESTYDILKQAFRKTKAAITVDPFDWYDENGWAFTSPVPGRSANEVATGMVEQIWHRDGCPSFKIYPEMLEAMADVSIEIPWEYLRFPYEAFSTELPVEADPLWDAPGLPRLRSILVGSVSISTKTKTSFRITKFASGAEKALHVTYVFDPDKNTEPNDRNAFDFTVSMHSDSQTIQQRLDDIFRLGDSSHLEALRKNRIYVPSNDMVRKVVGIAVATCFFGIDQHEVVMPHLTRKQITKRSNAARCSEIEAERLEAADAVKAGTKSWAIGKMLHLPRPLVARERDDAEQKGGISTGYLRRGHLRYQACGQGKQDRKLIFVSPHLCKPELGLKSTATAISSKYIENS